MLIDEDLDISAHGIAAKVLHLPGHSSGSIAVLTEDGQLLCGDLFANNGKPQFGPLIDDACALQGSFQRLRREHVVTVYPGHGKPFAMSAFDKGAVRS